MRLLLCSKFDEGLRVGQEKVDKKVGKKKNRSCKNSLKAGVSIDVIAQITGLSHSEISQLKEKT